MNDKVERQVTVDLANPSAPAVIVDPNPVSLLAQALAQNVSSEQLQQFMDLQERYEANEARKAYAVALVKCQKEMPNVMAQAEGEKTDSFYAKLGHINRLITPIYTKNGFSVTFGEGEAKRDGEIRTVGRLMHKLGHFEDFYCDLPLDLAGAQGSVNKTKIHAKGSSNSYGERYIIKRMFNLSILSEDDDATAAGEAVVNYISKRRVDILEELIAAQDDSFRPRVMEWLKGKGIESLQAIQIESYDACLKSIKSSAKISAELNKEPLE